MKETMPGSNIANTWDNKLFFLATNLELVFNFTISFFVDQAEYKIYSKFSQ